MKVLDKVCKKKTVAMCTLTSLVIWPVGAC